MENLQREEKFVFFTLAVEESEPGMGPDTAPWVKTMRKRRKDESSYGGPPTQESSGEAGRPRSSSAFDSLSVFQSRSIFHLPHRRRLSSGYFSFEGDSLPGSPLSPPGIDRVDRATQTPSFSAQALHHTLWRMAETADGGPGTHGPLCSYSRMQPQNVAMDRAEVAVGRQLRDLGDAFNLHLQRRQMQLGQAQIDANPPPPILPEPAVLLCVTVVFLMIGRIIYILHSHDHSQV